MLTRHGFSIDYLAHYYQRVIFLAVQGLAHLLEAVWGIGGIVFLNRTDLDATFWGHPFLHSVLTAMHLIYMACDSCLVVIKERRTI